MKIKLIFILFSFFIFNSCTFDYKHSNNYEDMYEEIYCPVCHGIGQVKMSTADKVVIGILSFGPGALCDTKQCEMCRGTGIVKRKKLK